MSLLSYLYAKSPVPIQNLGISMWGIAWRRRRYGGIFDQMLQTFRQREAWTAQQFLDYQTVQLRHLCLNAFRHVPYYRTAFEAHGLGASDLASFELDQLERLPILTKSTLRLTGRGSLLSQKPEPGGRFFSSSGSTGTPVQIRFSSRMHQTWTAAYEARVREWAQVDRWAPRGMIGGRRVLPSGIATPPYYRFNRAERQTYFSAYHIAPHTASDYLEGMKKHGASYLVGYAVSHYLLAQFIENAGLQAPPMRAVLTSSEKLRPEMRALFERVYGCRTYDAWSGVEACGLVSECPHGKLHVSPDIGIVELLHPESGQPVKTGEWGVVVCTGLINFDQPLIRYRIGDLMRWAEAPCPCGRQMPVVEEIIGREEDILIGPDGRQMVRFHNIFTDLPNIIEAQVVQHERRLFELILVLHHPLSPADRAVLTQRMRSQLGDIEVCFTTVRELPRESNGKFKAVRSCLSQSL